MAVGVGHNHETKENLGISALFEKLLLSRTKGIVADYAGTMTYYYLEVPVEKVPDAIAALAEMVTKTSFSGKEIEAAKADIIQHTKDMFPIPRRQLKLLYKHTAYGVADINWDMEGYINSVSRFTNEDLQAFARQFYVTHNMALLVGGNITRTKSPPVLKKPLSTCRKARKTKCRKISIPAVLQRFPHSSSRCSTSVLTSPASATPILPYLSNC